MKSNLIPEGATWVLFRHGDKTNNDGTPGGELTPLGKEQARSTANQLLERFGLERLREAKKLSSPVFRVKQTADISLDAWGLPKEYTVIPELEWGPQSPDHSDYIINNLLADYGGAMVIASGHDGLFNNISAKVHPGQCYSLGRGAAFIITSEGVEVIEPKVD